MYDICVIGAGSSGLTVAAAAARFGQHVVLIEKGTMGGDCLNYGCVPSKALIAAAKHAHALRSGSPFGIAAGEPTVDFGKVHEHVHAVVASIAPHDSQERFEGLGVRVIRAAARFTGPDTVVAGGEEITARRFVIAAGSSPAVPHIPGLEAAGYLTNETIFDLRELPRRLVVIGAGAIGIELGQAFARLGSEVTLVEAFRPLSKEDPELAQVVLDRLASDGVTILSGTRILQVARCEEGVRVVLDSDGAERTISGSHILVAIGRRANVDGLGLEAASIAYTDKGISVDRGLRTSNRKVYAIGDVAGGPQLTHAGSYHAGLVIRSALFRLPVRTKSHLIPRVTFTDPEIAQVGLTEAEARQQSGHIRVLRSPFHDNDRARTDRLTSGFIKVIAAKRGRILGASIVGASAGELIQPWCLAISSGLRIKSMLDPVYPYPTLGEVSRRAALDYFADIPSKPSVRGLIRMLRWLG